MPQSFGIPVPSIDHPTGRPVLLTPITEGTGYPQVDEAAT